MSTKLKCKFLSRERNLLHILIILTTSVILFISFPFIRNRYSVDADLLSHHVETDIGEGLADSLTIFHENTVVPRSQLKIEKPSIDIEILAQETASPYFTEEFTVVSIISTAITGYSSTVDQTNSEPFITASGSWVKDGIVAANFLPFGTKIRIPEIFGDKIFTVKDRMNRRYNNRVDVWFPTRQQAINLGIRHTYIEVVEN